ncbi:hypothetical protein H6503_03520 [Candidatus Woesearchaeota archaeon]|nr:hypothetical protein [Candidatus Woesearchaeota archaeon]
MLQENMEEMLRLVMSIEEKAGAEIMRIYQSGKFGMQTKEEGDLFGIADTTSNDILINALNRARPEFGILTEEKAVPEDMADQPDSLTEAMQEWRSRPYNWIIDSLDGTADFNNKNGMFGIHIGLTLEGAPILGANYYPVTGTFYFATKNNGAYIQTGLYGHANKIRVSNVRNLREARLVKSTAFPDQTIDRMIKDLKMPEGVDIGSFGLKVCKVAEGEAELYIFMNKKFGLWDACSSGLIISEAGGILTDRFGAEIKYSQDQVKCSNGAITSNGWLHNPALKIVDEYFR